MRMILASAFALAFSTSAFARDPFGTWKKSCSLESTTESDLVIELDELVLTTTNLNGDCKTKNFTTEVAVKYAIGKTNDKGYTEIDLTIETIRIAFWDEASIKFVNTAADGYCGNRDWKVGELRDITNCDGTNRAGEKFYTIFNIETVGDKTKLLFGKDKHDKSGSTPETRAVELDSEVEAYIKQ